MFKKTALLASALMMTVAPAIASAAPAASMNPAASLSLAPTARSASTHGRHKDELLGGSYIITIIAVIAIGVGITAAAGGFNSSSN